MITVGSLIGGITLFVVGALFSYAGTLVLSSEELADALVNVAEKIIKK